MAIGDILRVTATFTGPQAQILQWVWHYILTDDSSYDGTGAAAGIIEMLDAAWAEIDQLVDASTAGDTLDIALWDSTANEFNGIGTGDISHLVGTAVNQGSPGNVAPYVTFPTALPKSRGKKFLFTTDKEAGSDGALSGTTIAAMASFAAIFNNQVELGLAVARPGNFNLPTEVFRQWLTTSVGVGAFSGSQYRRLPGRGL